jgi:stearoyl-CoA desaturase (delta-9 desaturase)
VRQGFRWWEIDPTFYILKALSWVGVVWDLRSPPEQILRNEQRLGASVINRAAEQLAAHFNAEGIAHSIAAALHGPELTALRERLARAHDRTAEVLATLHLPQMPNMPHMPSREELAAKAKAMFAKTKSMEEIADRAYELLLTSVGAKLAGAIEGRP